MSLRDKIANDMGIDATYVDIIASRNNLYAKYYIAKKGGGIREILQPSKELKVLQRWLLKNILCYFPVSKYSYAYSKGNSVKKNASAHKKSEYLLHTDISDFFPSITREMLKAYFRQNMRIVNKLELSVEDIELILDLCLYRGRYLVVGSVASPRIANMIMYRFDTELTGELDKLAPLIYTRYADDIVISSQYYIDDAVVNIVAEYMAEYGFRMNRKKTYFMNKKCKRYVTGVVIDNNRNKLSVGNEKYKMIKRQIYNYLIKGDGNLEYITGYLAYIREINKQQYNQIRRIYIKYDKSGEIFSK